jgi:hypothetical protein
MDQLLTEAVSAHGHFHRHLTLIPEDRQGYRDEQRIDKAWMEAFKHVAENCMPLRKDIEQLFRGLLGVE